MTSSELQLKLPLLDEVSTGSGSDRVRSNDGGSRGEGDPVATAPGTDLMTISTLKVEL